MSDQQQFWNSKFQGETHFYGTAPNEYIRQNAELFCSGGKILCLGEGEGRNALFLAQKGHDITAIDASDVGLDKAKKLTQAHGHLIETVHMDLLHWEPEEESFNGIATSYLHLPQPLRKEVIGKSVKALKKGGIFVGEFFSQEQLRFSSGGPKDPGLLYSVDDMRENLSSLPVEIIELGQKEVELNEGTGHVGLASVIRLLFKKI